MDRVCDFAMMSSGGLAYMFRYVLSPMLANAMESKPLCRMQAALLSLELPEGANQ